MIQSAQGHYESLLADRYTWLYGGFEAKAAESAAWFHEQGVVPKAPSGRAADLGAGSGFQSIPLAEAGFGVDAVDLSATLLRELDSRAGLPGIAESGGSVRTIEADLVEFLQRDSTPASTPGSYELLVCMGDTLPHLESFAAVEAFFEAARQKLEPGGRLILGFRDLSQSLVGLDRFIPVRSDGERIFTCFLEYDSDEHVIVHDLIYERGPADRWEFHKSCYRKLRVGPVWIAERLLRAGFRIAHENMAQGFMTLIAER